DMGLCAAHVRFCPKADLVAHNRRSKEATVQCNTERSSAITFCCRIMRRPQMNTTKGPAPIEFWFDFASGYAYFAALEIEALAERHGRNLLWRPFTLGAAFKVTGAQGLSRTPLKGEYAQRDWQRLARLKGVVFKLPERHPKAGLAAIRAFYHID